MRFFAAIMMAGLMALPAAAITIDGSVDAEYGAPLAVQDTPTGFGDNENELNAAYAKLVGGDLALMLTGNLQNSSGNGLIIFIDSRAGGAVASTVGAGYGLLGSLGGSRVDNWGNDIDGGDGVSTPDGGASILDPGFNPDVALEMNIYDGVLYTNIIDMTLPNSPNADRDVYLGGNAVGSTPATHTYTRPGDGDPAKGSGGQITHVFDNSNTTGVTDVSAAGALSATTGYEALISSEFLQADGPIRIMAFITNGDGGYLANQFLGEAGVGGVGNLGSPGDIGGVPLFDAREFAGNQYFTVVPEPTTSALVAIAVAGALGFGRRRK